MKSAGARDDVALAQEARSGDRAAFAELVERHRRVAFRVAYLVTGSAADAEDATQEAFVKAYLRLDSFKPGAAFRPWLLTIVGNEARNRRRAEGRRLHYQTRAASLSTLATSAPSPEDAAESAEAGRRLVAAVNELPEAERLIVGLRYFLELSERETALAADVPAGTVKSRLSRALARLRDVLEGDDV